MNNLNYASFEASKRLVDAGIVLETDFYWARDSNGWYLRTYGTYERDVLESIPAPSMAEVWRELPCDTIVSKGNETYATTGFNGDNLEVNSINPTDGRQNIKYVGKCPVTGIRLYESDQGNDPRGILGNHAITEFVATEYGMTGPTMIASWIACNNDRAIYEKALTLAKKNWKEIA